MSQNKEILSQNNEIVSKSCDNRAEIVRCCGLILGVIEIVLTSIWVTEYCHRTEKLCHKSFDNKVLSQGGHSKMLRGVRPKIGSKRDGLSHKTTKFCHKTEKLCHKICDNKVLSQGGDSKMLRSERLRAVGRESAPESRAVPVAPKPRLGLRSEHPSANVQPISALGQPLAHPHHQSSV